MSFPNRYPEPPEVPEGAAAELNGLLETYFGPIIALYTPRNVSVGSHPEHIRQAWEGVSLPVRKGVVGRIENTHLVPVAAADAFNALVVAGIPDEILQYWVDCLPEHPAYTLSFLLEEGDLRILPQA